MWIDECHTIFPIWLKSDPRSAPHFFLLSLHKLILIRLTIFPVLCSLLTLMTRYSKVCYPGLIIYCTIRKYDTPIFTPGMHNRIYIYVIENKHNAIIRPLIYLHRVICNTSCLISVPCHSTQILFITVTSMSFCSYG
jgi:hypothetical protein